VSPISNSRFEGGRTSLAEVDRLLAELVRKNQKWAPAYIGLIVLGAAIIGVAGVDSVSELAAGRTPWEALSLLLCGLSSAISGTATLLVGRSRVARLERTRVLLAQQRR